jgi:hypothetical protein
LFTSVSYFHLVKLLYCLFFLLSALTGNSKKILKGVILDSIKNQPISNATVFVSGTSNGVKTNEQGKFSLWIPNGKYNLIAISTGYKAYNKAIHTNELPDSITISLNTKPNRKINYDRNGWEHWGGYFFRNLIGTSTAAQNCKIKNAEALHFLAFGQNNEFSVTADEPLVIENKALGYTITYQLDFFHYNVNTGYCTYLGFPFFQSMQGPAKIQGKWNKNRIEAYEGSVLHFMRSVYLNRINEEGFDVRRLQKVRNSASLMSNQHYLNDSDLQKKSVSSEAKKMQSLYDQILNPDDYKEIIGTALTADSIAYAIDKTTAGGDFDNFLLIIYKKKESPAEYQILYNETGMMSQIVLINQKSIEISGNGSYYAHADLMFLGYWEWSEKIGNMLPFDYVPIKL